MPDIPLPPENSAPESSDPPKSKVDLTVEETEQRLLKDLHQKTEAMHEALYELACFYTYSGRTQKTKELFQQLIDLSTSSEEKAHYLLSMGQLMEQREEFSEAVKYYKQASALEPEDNNIWYLIHNNLGYSLNQLGRNLEAETYCRLAIHIDSERYNAFKNLGIALEGQKEYTEAFHFFIVAIKKAPGEPRTLLYLSAFLEKHPNLLKEFPDLVFDLEMCSAFFPFLSERIKYLLDKFYRS